MFKKPIKNSGFTLIEVVIVSAITALVFGAIFSSFFYSLRLINLSRAKLSAISLANDRMEYFKSLPYDDVGTIGGLVPGTIPQNSTTTLNEINFTEHVLVEYVDDPSDDVSGVDSNAITTDYKVVRVAYEWEIGGVPGSIMMVTNVVPRSIETDVGGGTVRVKVVDADFQLLPGATVRLINSTLGIDTSRTTGPNGEALFSGAPEASDYEVVVSGPIGGKEYSIDKTYQADAVNTNPARAPFAVLGADISTLTFQIDELSNMSLALKSAITDGRKVDDLATLTTLASSTDVVSDGSALVLASTTSIYKNYGTAYLRVTPSAIKAWQAIRLSGSMPSGTSYRLSVLTGAGAGPYIPIPDSDLPGNSGGFTDTIISLTKLNPVTYPELVIGVILETSDTSVTPSIDEIGVYYRESETLLANESFTLHGAKVIGTDSSSNPIYKYDVSSTTDTDGKRDLGKVEFDTYNLTLTPPYDVIEGCPNYPFIQKAGAAGDFEFVTGIDNANSLRLTVNDSFGRAIPGVKIELVRSGYSEIRHTGVCGQAYFPGDTSAQSDFSATITATGYVTKVMSNINIDGDVQLSTVLDPA